MKKWASVLIVALTVFSFSFTAEAKGGGAKSSGSRSVSTPKASPAPKAAPKYGAPKPKAEAPKAAPVTPKVTPATPTTKPASGYGNPATKTVVEKSKTTSVVGKVVDRQASNKALQDYKAQQAKFKTPPSKSAKVAPQATASAKSSIKKSGITTRDDYYVGRQTFYATRSYTPPVYVYNSAPSFGTWDALMLWYMVDHVNDDQYAKMYYNHSNDPAFQEWRKEAERLSADNAELKAKLAALDTKVGSMKDPKDPNYLPAEVEGIAVAAEVAEAELPQASVVAALEPMSQSRADAPATKSKSYAMFMILAAVVLVAAALFFFSPRKSY